MWQTYLLTNIADLLQFFSLSILTLTLKEEQAMLARTEASSYKTKSRGNIEERFDQNEKQNENEEKRKASLLRCFSFCCDLKRGNVKLFDGRFGADIAV